MVANRNDVNKRQVIERFPDTLRILVDLFQSVPRVQIPLSHWIDAVLSEMSVEPKCRAAMLEINFLQIVVDNTWALMRKLQKMTSMQRVEEQKQLPPLLFMTQVLLGSTTVWRSSPEFAFVRENLQNVLNFVEDQLFAANGVFDTHETKAAAINFVHGCIFGSVRKMQEQFFSSEALPSIVRSGKAVSGIQQTILEQFLDMYDSSTELGEAVRSFCNSLNILMNDLLAKEPFICVCPEEWENVSSQIFSCGIVEHFSKQ
jgi:hypothetical protein